MLYKNAIVKVTVESLLHLSEQADYNPDDLESGEFDSDYADDFLDDVNGSENTKAKKSNDPEELVSLSALDDEDDSDILIDPKDLKSVEEGEEIDVDPLSASDPKEAIASIKSAVKDISTISQDQLKTILTQDIQKSEQVTPEEAAFKAEELVSQAAESVELPPRIASAVDRVMNRVNVIVASTKEEETASAILAMEKKAEAKQKEAINEFERRRSEGEDVPIPGTIGDYLQKGLNPYDNKFTFGKEIRSTKLEELIFGRTTGTKGVVSSSDPGLLSILNNELSNVVPTKDRGSVARMFQAAYRDNMFLIESIIRASRKASTGRYIYSTEALEDKVDEYSWDSRSLGEIAYFPAFSKVLIKYYDRNSRSFVGIPPLGDIISQIEEAFPKSVKFDESTLFELLPNELSCLKDEDSAIEAMVNDADNPYSLYNAVISEKDSDAIQEYVYNVKGGRSRFVNTAMESSLRDAYIAAIKNIKESQSNIQALQNYINSTIGDKVFGYEGKYDLDDALSDGTDYGYDHFISDFGGETEESIGSGNIFKKVVVKKFGVNPDNIDKPLAGQKAEPIKQELEVSKYPVGYVHNGIGKLKFLKMKYETSGLWSDFLQRCIVLHDRYEGATPGVFDDRYTLRASGGLTRDYMRDFCSNLIRQMDNDEDRKKLIIHMLRSARAAERIANGDMIKEDIILLERLGVGTKTAKRIVMTQYALGPNRRSVIKDENGDPLVDEKGRIKLKELGRSQVLSLDFVGAENDDGNAMTSEPLLSEIDSGGLEFVTNSQWGKMRNFTEELEANSVVDAMYKEIRRRKNAPVMASRNLASFYNSLSTKVKKAIIAEPVYTPLELTREVQLPDGKKFVGYVFDRDITDPTSPDYEKIPSVVPFDVRTSKNAKGIPTGKPIDHEALSNKLLSLKTVGDLDKAIVSEPPMKVTWLFFSFIIMRRNYKLRSARTSSSRTSTDDPTNVLTKELFGSKDFRDEFTGGFDFGSGERFLSINIPFINLLHEIFAFYSGMRRSIFNSVKSSRRINPAGVSISNPKSPKDVNPDIRNLLKMVLGGRKWTSDMTSSEKSDLIESSSEYFTWGIDRPNLQLISVRSLDVTNKDHQKILLDTHDLQKYYTGQYTLTSEFELSSLTELVIMLFGDTPINEIINLDSSKLRARYIDRFYNGDSTSNPPQECLSDQLRRITIDLGLIDKGSYLGYFDPISNKSSANKKLSTFLREAREADPYLSRAALRNIESFFGEDSVVKKALKKALDVADFPENSKEEISTKNKAMRLIGMAFDQSKNMYRLGVRVYNSKLLEYDTSYEYENVEKIADILNDSGYQCGIIGSPTYIYDKTKLFGNAYATASMLYEELGEIKLKLSKVTSKPKELKDRRKEVISKLTGLLSGIIASESAKPIKGRPEYLKFVIQWKARAQDVKSAKSDNVTRHSLIQDEDWESYIKDSTEYYASSSKTITSDTGDVVTVPASMRVVTTNLPLILKSKHIPNTEYPNKTNIESATPDGQLPFFPNFWDDGYVLKEVNRSEEVVLQDKKYYDPPTYFGGLVNVTPPGVKVQPKVPTTYPPITLGILMKGEERRFFPAVKKVTYKYKYTDSNEGSLDRTGTLVTYLISDNGKVIELPCKNVVTFVGATASSPDLNITPSSINPDALRVVDDYGNEKSVQLVPTNKLGYVSTTDPTNTPVPISVNPEVDENGNPVEQPSYDPLSMSKGRQLFMDYFEFELNNPRNIRVSRKVEGGKVVTYYTASIRPYSIKEGGLTSYMVSVLNKRRGLASQLQGGYSPFKIVVEDENSGERTAQMLRILAGKVSPTPALVYSGKEFKGWSDVELELPVFKIDKHDAKSAKPIILIPKKYGKNDQGEDDPSKVEEWTDASYLDLPKTFKVKGYNVYRPLKKVTLKKPIVTTSDNAYGYERTTYTRSYFDTKTGYIPPDNFGLQYRKPPITINKGEYEASYKKTVEVNGVEQDKKDKDKGRIITIKYAEPVLAPYEQPTFLLADALESDIPIAIYRVAVGKNKKVTGLNIVFTGGPFSKEHIEKYDPETDTRSPVAGPEGDIYTGPYAMAAYEPPPPIKMTRDYVPAVGREVDVYLAPKVKYTASKTDVLKGYSRSFDKYLPMMVQVARRSGKFTSVKHFVDRLGPVFIFKWKSSESRNESIQKVEEEKTVSDVLKKLLMSMEESSDD